MWLTDTSYAVAKDTLQYIAILWRVIPECKIR